MVSAVCRTGGDSSIDKSQWSSVCNGKAVTPLINKPAIKGLARIELLGDSFAQGLKFLSKNLSVSRWIVYIVVSTSVTVRLALGVRVTPYNPNPCIGGGGGGATAPFIKFELPLYQSTFRVITITTASTANNIRAPRMSALSSLMSSPYTAA